MAQIFTDDSYQQSLIKIANNLRVEVKACPLNAH